MNHGIINSETDFRKHISIVYFHVNDASNPVLHNKKININIHEKSEKTLKQRLNQGQENYKIKNVSVT